MAAELRHESRTFAPFIRFARDPELLREGDEIDGWRVLELPGHADGHICLERDGVLVAGDHLLGAITPTVGLYPDSRPDPLGDYQASLRRTIELAPRIALPGHGDAVVDPVARARAILEHHERRLDETAAALGKSRAAPTRSRSRSSAGAWTRAGAVSRWRRRSRTWNGSSTRAGPGAGVTTDRVSYTSA